MNLFGGTKYNHAEEDRLTNAFLSVMEKAPSTLLDRVLRSVGWDVEPGIVSATSQIPYLQEGSRPDGRIELRNFVVLIEAKRFPSFSHDQIMRHISGIEKHEDKSPALLCIGESDSPPIDLKKLSTERVPLGYLSWRSINRILEQESEASSSEIAQLLCTEFAEFLNEEGYAVYKEVNMEKIVVLANTYLSTREELSVERKNLENLGRSITRHVDSLVGQDNLWQYRVLDEVWMKRYGTLFQFIHAVSRRYRGTSESRGVR